MTKLRESHAPHKSEAKETLSLPDFPVDLSKQSEVRAGLLGVSVTDLLTSITEEWLVDNQ